MLSTVKRLTIAQFVAESCEEMPRYVRCECDHCNKKLRGSDKLIVDNNHNGLEILFCSEKCQQEYYKDYIYYPVEGRSHATTVDQYLNV